MPLHSPLAAVSGIEQLLLRPCAAGAQQLIDLHDHILRHVDEFGRALEFSASVGRPASRAISAWASSAPGVMRRSSMVTHAVQNCLERDVAQALAALAR